MGHEKVLELANKFAEEAEKLTTISDLADEFVIKLAEYKYASEAPPHVSVDDLEGIDEKTREEIRYNDKQKNPEYLPLDKAHNPPGAVKSEKTWDRAKKAVKPYFKKYKEPWAVTMYVYQQMHGKGKKKKKKDKKK